MPGWNLRRSVVLRWVQKSIPTLILGLLLQTFPIILMPSSTEQANDIFPPRFIRAASVLYRRDA